MDEKEQKPVASGFGQGMGFACGCVAVVVLLPFFIVVLGAGMCGHTVREVNEDIKQEEIRAERKAKKEAAIELKEKKDAEARAKKEFDKNINDARNNQEDTLFP